MPGQKFRMRASIFSMGVWLLMAIIILIDASKDMLVTRFSSSLELNSEIEKNEKNETTRRANNKYIRHRRCVVVVFIIVAPVAILPFTICTPCTLHLIFFFLQLWNVKITIRFPHFRSLENWINTHISALMRFHFALLFRFIIHNHYTITVYGAVVAVESTCRCCWLFCVARTHKCIYCCCCYLCRCLIADELVYWFTAFMPSVDFKYILMQIYRFMRNRSIVSHSFYLDLCVTCINALT